MGTFFSTPAAANAMKRLSGDQNRDDAPVVPGNICVPPVSRSRTRIEVPPRCAATTSATYRPSGETAIGEYEFASSFQSSGNGIASCTGRISAGRRTNMTRATAKPMAATPAMAATVHARRELRDRVEETGTAPSSSSGSASPMSRSRRRGSFWRQRCSSGRRRAGTAAQSGSPLMTVASVSETSSPANARRPVTIS
jgi:hypothetical protein